MSPKQKQIDRALRLRSSGKLRSDGGRHKTVVARADAPIDLQPPADDLVSVLRQRAAEHPHQRAFIDLHDGPSNEVVLTNAQLDQRARAIAAHLQDMDLVGQRVLLAFPHGLDFIAAFFGCLYAGSTVVPMCLPHRRTLDHFRAIALDSGARLVLSTATAIAQFKAKPQNQSATPLRNESTETTSTVPWLAVDDIPDQLAERWRMPVIAPTALAMLQYTSGSTSQPKGVMLSHANLIQNTRAIHAAFGMDRDTSVFWLPPYHDMGLIGGVLEPIFAGVTSVLMAPARFLQRPIDWLTAISKHRSTISGGPNFAYDMCVRKITDEQRATLDLSSWTLAFVGAEPIQPETLERFAKAFEPCGFKASAFYPCYGLAEATLMVSGAKRGGGATVRAFDESALEENAAHVATDTANKARRLVSSGTPVGDLHVAIVDSQTCTQVHAGIVGEIWVAGASVAKGYWDNPEQTSQSFNAYLNDTREGPFLRTGDIGFLFEGELFITGRQDDLLIVRGLNHHPQDIEATARKSHPLLEAGIAAAFVVHDSADSHDGKDQQLVLILEATRNGNSNYSAIIETVRAAILAKHGLAFRIIVLVRNGTIPRTSSGKVQRRACRKMFLAGELKTLAECRPMVIDASCECTDEIAVVTNPGSRAFDAPASNVTSAASKPPTQQSYVLAIVCEHAVALGRAALSDVTPDTSLTDMGLDSLQRAELAAMLEKTFACRLPDTEFKPSQTLGELARAVQSHLEVRSQSGAIVSQIQRQIPAAHYDFAHFPEYVELKRYERMLKAVAGDNPYFRIDQGGASSASLTRIEGAELVNFCTYDYIGMAHDADAAAAAKSAIDRYGTSAGASRLVSGEKQVHRDLEHALAKFMGTQAALVFVSGHATNVTTIGHLLGPEDLIVHDVLAHNSIIQGAQLSGATRRVFAHNDWQATDALLSEIRHRYRRVLIAIEGVYGMDGDYPELPRFVELKKKHKALMLVDEAHSLGTLGNTGRGIGEHYGVARTDVDLWMGTLSKSLASCGGYIAGSAQLVEYLGYTAPGFVYSVGMSPPSAAAALAALNLLDAQPQRVAKLRKLSALFLKLANACGLNTGLAAGTPVVPVIVGNSVKSLRLARALFNRGINVQPILHPAVPEHAARLRFFITTNHSEKQIRDTVSATADELAKL